MRLQKSFSEACLCSRRKAEEYILAGRVKVNDQVVLELGTRVDPNIDRVQWDGRPVTLSGEMIYVVLNKLKGVVTSCHQPGKRIVLDLVDLPARIYPIGRLDKDSSGPLLLTNDGRLHHLLSHPSFDHEKEYLVSVASLSVTRHCANYSKSCPSWAVGPARPGFKEFRKRGFPLS
jgi:23S rRNA pseudouridine2605 synthase/23S rRNA pseudouridine2604 synthase